MAYSVVKLAREIIEMDREIENLRYENEMLREYKQKYEDLLYTSIDNQKQTINGLFHIAVKLAGEKDNG